MALDRHRRRRGDRLLLEKQVACQGGANAEIAPVWKQPGRSRGMAYRLLLALSVPPSIARILTVLHPAYLLHLANYIPSIQCRIKPWHVVCILQTRDQLLYPTSRTIREVGIPCASCKRRAKLAAKMRRPTGAHRLTVQTRRVQAAKRRTERKTAPQLGAKEYFARPLSEPPTPSHNGVNRKGARGKRDTKPEPESPP